MGQFLPNVSESLGSLFIAWPLSVKDKLNSVLIQLKKLSHRKGNSSGGSM